MILLSFIGAGIRRAGLCAPLARCGACAPLVLDKGARHGGGGRHAACWQYPAVWNHGCAIHDAQWLGFFAECCQNLVKRVRWPGGKDGTGQNIIVVWAVPGCRHSQALGGWLVPSAKKKFEVVRIAQRTPRLVLHLDDSHFARSRAWFVTVPRNHKLQDLWARDHLPCRGSGPREAPPALPVTLKNGLFEGPAPVLITRQDADDCPSR